MNLQKKGDRQEKHVQAVTRSLFEKAVWIPVLATLAVALNGVMQTCCSFQGAIPTAPLNQATAPSSSSDDPKLEDEAAAAGRKAATVEGNKTLESNPNIFAELAKKIVPSVVNISTASLMKMPVGPHGESGDPLRRFFEDFFGNIPGHGGGGIHPWQHPRRRGQGQPQDSVPAIPKAMALGTGFIIDASGLILTNYHVIEKADEINVSFTEDPSEKPTTGLVVGRDAELDVALIQVKTTRPLVALALGDSDGLEVGEYVIAVGNPFGQGHSVTHGIISGKGRLLPDFVMNNYSTYLQTDAPINPGNSGGPLVNLKGLVVGINNAIDARAHGIGFAIPAKAVKAILPQLREKGSVARGFIGVGVDQLTPEVSTQLGAPNDLKAAYVNHVYPGQPADLAGVQEYDIILEFNGKTVHSSNELVVAVTSVAVGETVAMKVLRGGKAKTVQIKIAQRPNGAVAEVDRKKTKPTAEIDTGMHLENLTPELAQQLGLSVADKGVVVLEVAEGGPAARSGFLSGDLIVDVDQKKVKNLEEFFAIVKLKKNYLIRIRREVAGGLEGFAVVVLNLKD